MRYDIGLGGKRYRLELLREDDRWECNLDGREIPVQAVEIGADTLSLLIGGDQLT